MNLTDESRDTALADFPAAAVERAADQIVKETWGGPEAPAKKDQPQSNIIGAEAVAAVLKVVPLDDDESTREADALGFWAVVRESLRGEAQPDTDGREGLRSLEILIATYLSARDGRRVALPLEY